MIVQIWRPAGVSWVRARTVERAVRPYAIQCSLRTLTQDEGGRHERQAGNWSGYRQVLAGRGLGTGREGAAIQQRCGWNRGIDREARSDTGHRGVRALRRL